ncbi:histidine kinase phosphorylating Spo0A [Niallia circulans]|jgi:signal transduction histidine kinase|uniref:sensor histidine kinase n=1 Tax=Niallia circulans TaxID=1397 RepID=UPI00077C50B9|nr:HAMP domain-containing sensor histidine kinase [Niallia circulans]MDR4315162.1 HAMP domain-containing histidine kinase [Niallia circulans]MED3839896.1 HAMP domain-containing sensor histidine kinase [Niallia circulans]MED4241382.1 HAMP domain-containing sensor histidine kinase [Niallia circulans]MED4248043.1 HAMP domain-containing sensor histidine kinase [Niallia circulans]MED5103380.1 HAMP domain-containing sensor histidine kinase [Niallia circulans]
MNLPATSFHVSDATFKCFINKWKHVEEKLQEQSATMEALTDSLQSLSLSTTYSENIAKMVTSITHEVRNPLTSVSGFLQLIKQTNNVELIHQYTDIALGELTRANELITDFLTLSKQQADDITPLSINELLLNLIPIFKSEAHLKDINLITRFSTDELLCKGHKQHLTQVLVNIVKNAFEATEENLSSIPKEVTIATRKQRNQLVIEIKDNGCGIPEAQLKNLFIPLQTTKKNGTGMGLYVCKQLVEKYDGKMNIISSREKGTTMSIFFPLYNS